MDSPDIDIDAVLASKAPLSSLPTPPPSRETARGEGHAAPVDAEAASLDCYSSLSEPADHLISLLPSNTYAHQPVHRPTVLAYLEAAHLPHETLGLAACILGNITNSFVRTWRQDLFYARISRRSPQCIVLAALCVAASFLDDSKSSTVEQWLDHGKSAVAGAIWPSMRELSATVRCVLREIDYEMHAFTPEVVAEAVQELYCGRRTMSSPLPNPARRVRASDEAGPADESRSATEAESRGASEVAKEGAKDEDEDTRRDSGYVGAAAWSQGLVTPEPTPPLHTPVDAILGGTFLQLL